jgi:hypothetical protein
MLLMGKPEAKRPLGRPRHRYMYIDNIKIDFTEIDGVVWTRFFWLRIWIL